MPYLVTDQNNVMVEHGDTVTDFRGQPATFHGVSRGVEYNGTAKVTVHHGRGECQPDNCREYYARVFNLTVITISGE